MTDLHAEIHLLEGELPEGLVGTASGLSKRRFAVLKLTRDDGTTGEGEASPLPGYSPDSTEEAVAELQCLADEPLRVDPLASPFDLLTETFAKHPMTQPSARLALETALLDWLGRSRGEPVHQVLGGDVERRPIPIADLVMEPTPALWPERVDGLIAEGATHLKFKIGTNLDSELASLEAIRQAHPSIPLRLDANRRISLEGLRRHRASFESLEVEFIEEPVAPEDWTEALKLPLPFALDETLRDRELSERLLATGNVRAVVIKPMVVGGLRESFELAELAASHGAKYLVSHTFDGPIARAVTAELALALQTEPAAGLGAHPALDLWPPNRIAAIHGREILPHAAPGLGLEFRRDLDA